MTRYLSILLVGIGIGYFARSLWRSEDTRAPEGHAEVVEAAPRPAEVRTSTLSHVVRRRGTSAPEVSVTAHQEPIARASVEPESTRGLVVDEKNISEMERQQDQLRAYAYATQTVEGWRIQILPDDRVFMKAGLASGDLITFESMNSQLQRPDRARLANRLVAILHSIER